MKKIAGIFPVWTILLQALFDLWFVPISFYYGDVHDKGNWVHMLDSWAESMHWGWVGEQFTEHTNLLFHYSWTTSQPVFVTDNPNVTIGLTLLKVGIFILGATFILLAVLLVHEIKAKQSQ